MNPGQSWGFGRQVANYVPRVGIILTRVVRLFAGGYSRLYTCIKNAGRNGSKQNGKDYGVYIFIER